MGITIALSKGFWEAVQTLEEGREPDVRVEPLLDELRTRAQEPQPEPPPWIPKKDERVEVLVGGKWVPAKTCSPPYHGYHTAPVVAVRRIGCTTNGRQHPIRTVPLTDVRQARDFDPTKANIYADWLEEQGELPAAQKLREAFPLS